MKNNYTGEPVQITTEADFNECQIGQLVEKSGKIGYFAGMEPGGCNCFPGGQTFLNPVIIYPIDDNTFEMEKIAFLEPPAKKRITGMSYLRDIGVGDDLFKTFQQIINLSK